MKKNIKSTQINLLSPQLRTRDQKNPIERKVKRKKHEDQFLTNQILKDEIEIKSI
jgi:hypothetical protein